LSRRDGLAACQKRRQSRRVRARGPHPPRETCMFCRPGGLTGRFLQRPASPVLRIARIHFDPVELKTQGEVSQIPAQPRLAHEGPEASLGNLLSPALLLHKGVEEREKTPKVSLHEPAMPPNGPSPPGDDPSRLDGKEERRAARAPTATWEAEEENEVPRRFRWVESWSTRSGPVAQTSKSAVSPASQPAGRTANPVAPIWKSATQQVWKPALRDGEFH